MTHVVILGAGFGGLELTSRLAEDLPGEVEVTLIDKSDWFVFGYQKLDVMFGKKTFDAVKNPYADINKPGVTFKKATIQSIDPNAKRVVTEEGTYDADILVVALGADLRPEQTPGLLEAGYEYYSPEGADHARGVVDSFNAGVAIVGVLGPFFKCPAAPCETALMLHDRFVEHGVRDGIEIKVLSPMGIPIPISQDTSKALLEEFEERGIEYHSGTRVVSIDPRRRPRRPRAARRSAFRPLPRRSGSSGARSRRAVGPYRRRWLDRRESRDVRNQVSGRVRRRRHHECAGTRAGVIAEGEARTVADVIVKQLRGGPEPEPYYGRASCYIEFGGELVGRVEVDFMSGPEIKSAFGAPSLEIAKDKEQFGATRAREVVRYMSMWQGQRIVEVDVTDADAGREHNVLLDVRNANEWDAGHTPARCGCRSPNCKARISNCRSIAGSCACAARVNVRRAQPPSSYRWGSTP